MKEEKQEKIPENEQFGEKITFEYKISPHYALHSIMGAHGGPNAKREIVVNFYSERASIPKTETFKIDQDGKLIQPPEIEQKKSIIRDVVFGAALRPIEARAIGQWLIERANEVDKMDN